jgi:hypothetical protein
LLELLSSLTYSILIYEANSYFLFSSLFIYYFGICFLEFELLEFDIESGDKTYNLLN